MTDAHLFVSFGQAFASVSLCVWAGGWAGGHVRET